MTLGLLVLLAAAAAVAVAGIGIYNGLVRLQNASENAWSDVDVQLKRRYELVPNLVATVKGYASHERKTLEDVVQARSRAMGAGPVADRASAEGDLTRALSRLFALAEAYPELRANESFLSLQRELSQLEDVIQKARRYYNAVVRDLNTRCETFPSVIVARSFGFEQREYFELDAPDERVAPAVSFDG